MWYHRQIDPICGAGEVSGKIGSTRRTDWQSGAVVPVRRKNSVSVLAHYFPVSSVEERIIPGQPGLRLIVPLNVLYIRTMHD